eukprot:1549940-Prymnesium_polylepis.2
MGTRPTSPAIAARAAAALGRVRWTIAATPLEQARGASASDRVRRAACGARSLVMRVWCARAWALCRARRT